MAKLDLTGRRYGKLLVLRESPSPYISPAGVKTRRWDCLCDCGRQVTVLQNALTSCNNGTRSCGCSRREIAMTDLIGQRFGRLVVRGKAPLSRSATNGAVTGWRCRCDCGREVVVPTRYLTTGKGKRSCGCLAAESAADRVAQAVGQVEGTTLTAISPNRPANKNSRSGVKGVYWSRREDCWIAKIGFRGRTITLGRFAKIEDAIKARTRAEEEYYGPVLNKYKGG